MLDDAIVWIKANMGVDDIFDREEIVEWVGSSVDIEDTYGNSELGENGRK